MREMLSQAVGRRKSSVARARLYQGTGSVVVNGRALDEHFRTVWQRGRVMEPLRTVNLEGHYDIHVNVEGGGTTGQADAVRLAIARALVGRDPELRRSLKKAGLLTRDARAVESKKYGLKKARRAEQYTKR